MKLVITGSELLSLIFWGLVLLCLALYLTGLALQHWLKRLRARLRNKRAAILGNCCPDCGRRPVGNYGHDYWCMEQHHWQGPRKDGFNE